MSNTTEEGKQAGTGRFNVVQFWPIVAAITTAAIVVSSVLYDWSYFQAVYPPALSLLSVSDHVSSGLRWIPGSVAGNVFGWLIVFFMGQRQPTGIVTKRPPWSARRWFIVGIIGPTLFIASRLFFVPQDWVVDTAVIGGVLGYVIVFQLARARAGDTVILVVGVLIALSSIAISQGDLQAIYDLTAKAGDTTIVTNEGPKIDGALVLRFLERGVLVRVPATDQTMLLSWDDIQKMNLHSVKWDSRWQSCISFAWFCDSRAVDSPKK